MKGNDDDDDTLIVYGSHANDANYYYACELETRNLIDRIEWEESTGRLDPEQVKNLKDMLESNDPESIVLAKEIIKVKVNGT